MITKDYAEMLQLKHQDAAFGVRSEIPDNLKRLLESGKVGTALDFGCGKGRLVETLNLKHPAVKTDGYDPANPRFATLPDAVDLVFSTDVLEHIEPPSLVPTLEDLCTRSRLQYHLIACHYATNLLADGRNAHLIVKTPDVWQEVFYALGWNVVHEAVFGFVKQRRERPLAITHYEVVISKP